MIIKNKYLFKKLQYFFQLLASTILILSMLIGCSPSTQELEVVDYIPLPEYDWEASTPAEQGVDPMLVAKSLVPITCILMREPVLSSRVKRIHRPSLSDVWLAVSRDEIDGQAALMQGQYPVDGDFNLLLKFNEIFR